SRFARKYAKPGLAIARDALTRLTQYHWPGNIRELVHSVERAVIMAESDTLRLDDLLLKQQAPSTDTADLNLESIEARAIRQAIARHQGNLSQAARELGLG